MKPILFALALLAFMLVVDSAAANEPADLGRHGAFAPVRGPQVHQRVARRAVHVARSVSKGVVRIASLAIASGRLTVVPTAAGIDIKVDRAAAPKFQGLIADMVAAGYRPKRINCFADGHHVPNSFHYTGEACDIDNRENRHSPSLWRRLASIIAKHGLRDGCSFRYGGIPDCGHVDTGSPKIMALVRRPHPLLGAAPANDNGVVEIAAVHARSVRRE